MKEKYEIRKETEMEDFPHFSMSTRYWLVKLKQVKFLTWSWYELDHKIKWHEKRDEVVRYATDNGYTLSD